MAFNTTALTEYVSPGTEMLLKEILPLNLEKFSIQSGIKHKEYLNFLSVTPVKSQTYCGTGSGTDVMTEKLIEVANYNYKDNFCIEKLDSYAVQNIDVASALATDMLRVPHNDAQHDIWSGDITGSADYIDGWLTILSAAGSGAITATETADVTISNIDDIVIDMINKRTKDIRARGVSEIFMSPANFDLYRLNRAAANLYADLNNDLSAGEMWATAFNGQVKISSNEGIESDEMILTWSKNLVIGTDEITNITSLEFREAPDRSVNAFLDFKLGAQIRENGECVYYKNI